MRRAIPLLLLVLTPLLADEPKEILASFRLKREPLSPMRGYISEVSEDGFRFRTFGVGGKRLTVRWDALVAEDAQRMRIEFKLELTEDEKRGLMEGHRIRFRGGGYDEGLLVRVDEDGKHWLKVRGLMFPYPRNRVDGLDTIKIEESKVYDKDELYLRRLERVPPSTFAEHRRLADRMFDVGNFDKAHTHYDEAIALEPGLERELRERREELAELRADAELAGIISKARVAAILNGNFDKGRAMLQEYIDGGGGRTAARALGDLERVWQDKQRARFMHTKHIAASQLVRKQIALGKLDTVQQAMNWVTAELPAMLKQRIMRTMDLTDEQYDAFMANKGKGAPHFAGYWSGSFIRQKRGVKTAGKGIKADPERWWGGYDVQTKANWLKAYMAESLGDIFEIVSVRHTDCNRCGGTGRVRKMSLTPAAGGKHEWKEICPRCFGARQDRSVSYR